MYFTNEQVVEEINRVFIQKTNNYGNNNNALDPKLDDILALLNERKPILFFYLTTEHSEPENAEGDMQVPTINMKLNQFFIHPLGDHIWTDDESFKFITKESYEKIRDSINASVEERLVAYKVVDYTEFVQRLNHNKKVGG
jgi:hypothetical protein